MPHSLRSICVSVRPRPKHRAAVHRRPQQTRDSSMPRLARSHAVRHAVVEEVMPEPRPEHLRLLEALLFAASEPIDAATLAARLPEDVNVEAALAQLKEEYAPRGVNLVSVAGKWTFRTASDLAWLLSREATETRKLSRAALETLAIVSYHQPVTR